MSSLAGERREQEVMPRAFRRGRDSDAVDARGVHCVSAADAQNPQIN